MKKIQVLVSTPDVRVQVPPRAPKALKRLGFKAFSFSEIASIFVYEMTLDFLVDKNGGFLL